ncbi:nucleotide pyrophosphohydrolase [Psychrobacillus sp. INOP01]|uniref:nucleotide pyrophosphohydrolase n=1 Tax=Psychrobacillus sp. INOP01 TaxID=2829187 RepID=UPI001BAB9BA8|nr:nucleotide pyrophosphohydrolase [Psychrobacillus sp. INOP01]QUG43354.1 nucleotide pyrophosphohydrolase [Psychrobacillus sp. INOP01]
MKELTEEIRKFRYERGWGGNPDARSLAISVSLEASELLEHFQWVSAEDAIKKDKQAIADEAADVFIYLLQFADVLGIDLKDAAQQKMKKNALKYPAPQVD